jgi:hypothetical protein
MNARGMSAIETAADASFHGLFKAAPILVAFGLTCRDARGLEVASPL